MVKTINIKDNEFWWGGSCMKGNEMPFDKDSDIKLDLNGTDAYIQTMPLLLSSKGRYIWSDEPFSFEFKNGVITLEGNDFVICEEGKNLKDAYLTASNNHFPFDNKPLREEFFTTAQYNCWMQFNYNPTEEGILEYAKGIVDNGFEPGILIIDEGWHGRYGTWEFDRAKFPNPKEMVEKLHAMGFKVMLWVCPYVCPDGERYVKSLGIGSELDGRKVQTDLYLRTEDNDIALCRWWNGTSAILDMTKETDIQFLKNQLDNLVSEYKIDGFKFDGGSVDSYLDEFCVNGKIDKSKTPHERNIAWNEFGRQYDFHEYKDTYKGGGKCVISRLLDRDHSWTGNGINTIIENSLIQGIIGHPFICPDMIGGGSWNIFLRGIKLDEELFVRMAEVSTYFPMMQYSLAPWKFLNEENLAICVKMAKKHKELSEEILKMVNESRINGEPIVRHLAYEFPEEGYEKTNDMFMFGSDTLVAPIIVKGQFERKVKLPKGKWEYIDGTVFEGGCEVTVPSPIDVIPVFRRR